MPQARAQQQASGQFGELAQLGGRDGWPLISGHGRPSSRPSPTRASAPTSSCTRRSATPRTTWARASTCTPSLTCRSPPAGREQPQDQQAGQGAVQHGSEAGDGKEPIVFPFFLQDSIPSPHTSRLCKKKYKTPTECTFLQDRCEVNPEMELRHTSLGRMSWVRQRTNML